MVAITYDQNDSFRKECAICGRYMCDDSNCETGCCQGHCTICELPVIAKACPECPDECSYHCKCKETN